VPGVPALHAARPVRSRGVSCTRGVRLADARGAEMARRRSGPRARPLARRACPL